MLESERLAVYRERKKERERTWLMSFFSTTEGDKFTTPMACGAQWLCDKALDWCPSGVSKGCLTAGRVACVLEQDSLVLVQPRKNCPNMTENLLTGT